MGNNSKHFNGYQDKLDGVIKRLDTSFFFYDLDALKKHLTVIADTIDKDVRLWYACKANPLSAILKVLRNLGFGIDVASTGELDQVIRIGIGSEDLIATGPAKSKEYLKNLLENNVENIVLESLNQAYWLDEVAKELGKRPKALLRVQLDWQEGSSVLGGNEITPFGIDATEWMNLEKDKVQNIDINGYHVFQWGNILDLNRLRDIWFEIAAKLQDLSKSMAIPLEVLDLGGGVGIPYTFDDEAPDFKDINAILVDLKKNFDLNTIWLEFGRYTIGEFGYYFTKVIDRKIVRGREIIVTDGGINHISRPALTDQAFPCDLYRDSDADRQEFHVHGPLCTALDKLGSFQLPSDIEPGDWLFFGKAGAYGFTESMPFFLCHQMAAEVTYYNGDMMIPRLPVPSSNWLV